MKRTAYSLMTALLAVMNELRSGAIPFVPL